MDDILPERGALEVSVLGLAAFRLAKHEDDEQQASDTEDGGHSNAPLPRSQQVRDVRADDEAQTAELVNLLDQIIFLSMKHLINLLTKIILQVNKLLHLPAHRNGKVEQHQHSTALLPRKHIGDQRRRHRRIRRLTDSHNAATRQEQKEVLKLIIT